MQYTIIIRPDMSLAKRTLTVPVVLSAIFEKQIALQSEQTEQMRDIAVSLHRAMLEEICQVRKSVPPEVFAATLASEVSKRMGVTIIGFPVHAVYDIFETHQ